MPRSDRGKQSAARLIGTILVAVLGIGAYWAMFYSAGYGSGYNERQAHIEAKHYASDTPQQIERECGAKAGEATRECIAKIIDAERESQRSESDLAAQWKAADWVMWAGIIAGAQLIATALGLYFVKRTLDATLEAVEDTGKATQAMERQNELAARQQRPWIWIESVEVTIGRNSTNSGINKDGSYYQINKYDTDAAVQIIARFRFINKGITPAKNITCYTIRINGEWSKVGEPSIYGGIVSDFYKSRIADRHKIFTSVLMPNESSDLTAVIIVDENSLSAPNYPNAPNHTRALPRYAIFVEYDGEGIKGCGEAGKVFAFSILDGGNPVDPLKFDESSDWSIQAFPISQASHVK